MAGGAFDSVKIIADKNPLTTGLSNRLRPDVNILNEIIRQFLSFLNDFIIDQIISVIKFVTGIDITNYLTLLANLASGIGIPTSLLSLYDTPQLLLNGNFTGGLSLWAIGSAAFTIAQDALHGGINAMVIDPVGTLSEAFGQKIPAVVGHIFNANAFVHFTGLISSGEQNPIEYAYGLYNSAGELVDTVLAGFIAAGTNGDSAGGDYIEIPGTPFAVPTGIAFVGPILRVTEAATGGVVKFSNIELLKKGASVPAAIVQGLVDAIAIGFGGVAGMGFAQLQSFIGLIPGAQQLIDVMCNVLGLPGTGHTLLELATSLANIPGDLITSVLSDTVIPNLNAAKITAGEFNQSVIQPIIDLIAKGWDATAGQSLETLGTFIQGLPKVQTIIDTLANAFGLPGSGHGLSDLTNIYRNLWALYGEFNFAVVEGIFNPVAAWQHIINNILNPAGLLLDAQTLFQKITGITGPVTNPLESLASAISNGIFGSIAAGRIPLVSVSSVAVTSPNLLADSGFNTALGMPGDWTRNAGDGHSSPGCAQIIPDGQTHKMQSDPLGVAPGQTMPISIWVKWIGTVASVNSNAIKLNVLALHTNSGSGSLETMSSTELAHVPTANGNSSNPTENEFVQIQGSYTVPGGADHVIIEFELTPGISGGIVRIDDGSAAVTGLIARSLVDGLTDVLTGIAANFTAFLNAIGAADFSYFAGVWNNLMSILGLSGPAALLGSINVTTIWTNIVNSIIGPLDLLASKFGLDTLASVINQIGDVFDDALVIPINGAIAQIQGFYGLINGFKTAIEGFLLSFVNGIIGIFGGVPFVGGILASQAASILWGAFGGLISAFNVGLTGVAPAAATSDVLIAAVDEFKGNVSTVSQQVTTFIESNQQTILGKYFGGGIPTSTSSGFGSDWQVDQPTWVKILERTGLQVIPSGTSARTVKAMHNSGPTISGHQSGRIMFYNMMPSGTTAGNSLIMRADSKTNPQNYIFLRFYYDHIHLGCVVSGTEVTAFGKDFAIVPSFGVTYNLLCGTGGGDYEFELYANDLLIGTHTDVGSPSKYSQFGSGYQESGMFFHSAALSPLEAPPASVQYWKMQDNLTNGPIGSAFKVVRTDTTGVLFDLAGAGARQIPSNFYDATPDYMTADWSWDRSTNLFTCENRGRYDFSLRLPFLTSTAGIYTPSPAPWQALLAKNAALIEIAEVRPTGSMGLSAEYQGIQCEAGDQIGPVYSYGSGGSMTISGGYGAQTSNSHITSFFSGKRVQ